MAEAQTIKLAEAWTYRTPQKTVHFPSGEHEVSAEIAAAAPKVKDEDDGEASKTAKADAPRPARKSKG